MQQRKTIFIVIIVLIGLFLGKSIKFLRVGMLLGLLLGLIAAGLWNSKNKN